MITNEEKYKFLIQHFPFVAHGFAEKAGLTVQGLLEAICLGEFSFNGGFLVKEI
jgi:hypothetical protein